MGQRIWRYATSANASTGETNGGGASSNFLVYQTDQSVIPSTMKGGTSTGMVMGPDETGNMIVCAAHSSVNSASPNEETYDVTFYGGPDSSESKQLAAINGAVAQMSAAGVDVSSLENYPYSSDPDGAATEINQAGEVPIIVSKDDTIS